MEKNPFELTDEVKQRYFKGWRNKLIRVYYYLREGLNLLNDFKYLIAGILAFYYILKVDSFFVLSLMFVFSIPILIASGYFWVHKAKKSIDWFSVEFTTHFSKYNYTLMEESLKYTKKVAELLEKMSEKNDRNN